MLNNKLASTTIQERNTLESGLHSGAGLIKGGRGWIGGDICIIRKTAKKVSAPRNAGNF